MFLTTDSLQCVRSSLFSHRLCVTQRDNGTCCQHNNHRYFYMKSVLLTPMDNILFLERKKFLHTKSDPLWSYQFTVSFYCYWLKGLPVFPYILTRREQREKILPLRCWNGHLTH